jgi:hypothetical protein
LFGFRYSEPRTVILHKGQRGFGFVLRGAKTMTGMKDFNPIQNRVPALQYLDSVEAGSVADRAGLQPGDFILAVSFFDFLHRVRIYLFFSFFFYIRSMEKIWPRLRTRLWSIVSVVRVIWFS